MGPLERFFLAGKVFQHNIATLGRFHNLKLFAKYAMMLMEKRFPSHDFTIGSPCPHDCSMCENCEPSSIEVTFPSAEKSPYTKKPEI